MRMTAVLLFVLASCQTVTKVKEFAQPFVDEKPPLTVSARKEMELGDANFGARLQKEGGEYLSDKYIVSYVQRIGHKLSQYAEKRYFHWEFVVLNNASPMMWSLPGGKVAVSRGLLTELGNEAELALLLAREIVHCDRSHRVAQMLLENTTLLNESPYTESQEREADLFALRMIGQAGYDAKTALSSLKQINTTEKRFTEALAYVDTFPAAATKTAQIRMREYRSIIEPLKGPSSVSAIVTAGEDSLSSGRTFEALEKGRQARAINAKDVAALMLIGKAAQKRHDTATALEAFDAAIAAHPFYYESYLERGTLHFELKNYTNARADYEKSLELLPTSQAHYMLGRLFLREQKRNQSLRHLRLATSVDDTASQEAAALLATLEISELSSKYVELSFEVGSDGYLVIVVDNISPIAIKNVFAEVAVYDIGGKVAARQHIAIPDTIASQQLFRHRCEIGPFPARAKLKESISLHLMSAEADQKWPSTR